MGVFLSFFGFLSLPSLPSASSSYLLPPSPVSFFINSSSFFPCFSFSFWFFFFLVTPEFFSSKSSFWSPLPPPPPPPPPPLLLPLLLLLHLLHLPFSSFFSSSDFPPSPSFSSLSPEMDSPPSSSSNLLSPPSTSRRLSPASSTLGVKKSISVVVPTSPSDSDPPLLSPNPHHSQIPASPMSYGSPPAPTLKSINRMIE